VQRHTRRRERLDRGVCHARPHCRQRGYRNAIRRLDRKQKAEGRGGSAGMQDRYMRLRAVSLVAVTGLSGTVTEQLADPPGAFFSRTMLVAKYTETKLSITTRAFAGLRQACSMRTRRGAFLAKLASIRDRVRRWRTASHIQLSLMTGASSRSPSMTWAGACALPSRLI